MAVINSASKLVFLYILSASLSTLVNICGQILTMQVYNGAYAIVISMIIGTLVGLPLRYILDKRFIFSFESKNLKHDGKLFLLYSSMGLFTTAIFWLTEYMFHLIFMDNFMRYIGGTLGLSIGYFIKFWLDKSFVFVKKKRVIAL